MIDSFSNPEKIVKKLDLSHGMVVADFGSGRGEYSLELSKAVGEDGIVYAVDVRREMVNSLLKEAKEDSIKNIEGIWGDIETLGGSKLKEDSVDLVVIANTFFQIESKISMIREAARVLKSGGALLLIDWSESFQGIGPHVDHIVDAHTSKELFEHSGFEFFGNIEAGAHHYGMLFRNNSKK